MKRIIQKWCSGPKDLLAIIIISTFCLSYLVILIAPGIEFNELMSRQYERIMIMVVSYYFGSHREKTRNTDDLLDNPK